MKAVRLVALIALMVLGVSLCARGEEVPVRSRVSAVTVYRGQAMVTRTVELPDATGELELVVPDLPANVLPESLFAGGEAVTVRSVRFRQRALAQVPRQEVAELDEQIRNAQDEMFALQQQHELLASREAYLQKLENFTAPTAQVEMSKGVLDPEALVKISVFLFEQRAQLAQERVELKKKTDAAKERLSLLERRRAELAATSQKTAREAVLFVTRPAAGGGSLHLGYLVNGADWSPAYNVRLGQEGQQVSLEYLGHIRQASGEDWTNVELSLSTASPQMNAEIPLLVPLWVALQTGRPEPQAAGKPGDGAYVENFRRQMAAQEAWKRQGDNRDANWLMNENAARNQYLEFNVEGKLLRGLAGDVRAVREGLAVTYALPSRLSLPSRSDVQVVQIRRAELPAASYYQAVPLLADFVFRGAELTNALDVPLLAGPYAAYRNGEFVGGGQLPIVATGQSFDVGFGIDPQLRCRRELLDKSDQTALGSRVQTLTYALFVESFKDQPVSVRLLDRIPVTKGRDMQVSLTKTSQDLSDDEAYLARDRKEGILRWDLEVPAGASGPRALRVEYSFEMKYADDRNLNVRPAEMLDEMRMEFEQRFQQKR